MSSIDAVNFENAVDMIWEKVATSRVWQYLDRRVGFSSYDDREELYSFHDKGVDASFTDVGDELRLTSLVFYLETTRGDAEDPGFKRYEGILPYRLPSGLTKQVLLDRFGEPTAIGKEQQHPVFGRMLPWINTIRKTTFKYYSSTAKTRSLKFTSAGRFIERPVSRYLTSGLYCLVNRSFHSQAAPRMLELSPRLALRMGDPWNF